MEIKKIVLLPDLKKNMFFVEEFVCPGNIVKMPISNCKRPRQPPPPLPNFYHCLYINHNNLNNSSIIFQSPKKREIQKGWSRELLYPCCKLMRLFFTLKLQVDFDQVWNTKFIIRNLIEKGGLSWRGRGGGAIK